MADQTGFNRLTCQLAKREKWLHLTSLYEKLAFGMPKNF
jgi:hypothetical protein